MSTTPEATLHDLDSLGIRIDAEFRQIETELRWIRALLADLGKEPETDG